MSTATKYSFMNDYSETAHPRILDALIRTNSVQHLGYGLDSICVDACKLIREECGKPNATVYFVSGGTQANLITILSILRPWEAVIATHLGHIATNEAGAIEAGGHKVITAHCEDGKLKPHDIDRIVAKRVVSDYVEQPKMVYISNTTEIGTIYDKSELEALRACCNRHQLYLFIDGARLGSALSCSTVQLNMADIAANADVFYIGGTKNGIMFGEAIVICNSLIKPHFRGMIRRQGGLLAKGWLLGAQFIEMFKDGLYYELALHANAMAAILREGIESCGFHCPSPHVTNQLFFYVPQVVVKALKKHFIIYEWSVEEEGGFTLIRVCTSWATPEEQCHHFVDVLKKATSMMNGSLTQEKMRPKQFMENVETELQKKAKTSQ